ncbi:MAG: UDP-N-acetylmuramoyl-tripeptide--D-alanyl-D-alanine ligase [Anaerolineales bacterium]
MLTLADILEALTGIRTAKPALVIPEAGIDSRRAIPGSLFIAIPGERVDGHNFIEDAFQRGASLALVQRELPSHLHTLDVRTPPTQAALENLQPPFCLRVNHSVQALQTIARFWRTRLNLRTIGITGSVGKSTTKEVIADVLEQRYTTLRTIGNLNNEIGLPLTLLRLSEGHQVAVLEMGFYVPGEIALLCEIARPQMGVITNIGTVHAERAGSQEVIARGKSELVQALPADGWAVLNHDDPWVRWMANKTSARIFYYGLTPEAHLWADRVEGLGLEGIRFRMHYRDDVLHVRIPMIGRHSMQTALRAAAVGLLQGLGWQEIIEGLRSGSSAQLRLVAVRAQSGALLLDDTYNASPESVLAALNLLAELEGRKIAVLGDMLELGRYERQGHEMVGVRAAELSHLLVTVGARAHMIAQAAHGAGMARNRIYEFENNTQVIDFLRARLTENDSVLIKGSRSMHMEEIVEALETRR